MQIFIIEKIIKKNVLPKLETPTMKFLLNVPFVSYMAWLPPRVAAGLKVSGFLPRAPKLQEIGRSCITFSDPASEASLSLCSIVQAIKGRERNKKQGKGN